MMNNESFNKEVLFKFCVAFSIFVLLCLALFVFIIKKKEIFIKEYNEVVIPEIKETFTSTKLNKYVEFDNPIISRNNKLIINNSNKEYYLTYENDKLTYQEIHNLSIKSNYGVYTNEKTNKKYFINNANKTVSDEYDNIIEVTFDNNSYNYLILVNNDIYSILNLETDEIIYLDNNIIYIDELYKYNIETKNYEIISNKYLKVFNGEKYGIIDYKGNYILEMIYDNIVIDGNYFIVRENNKYSLIDYNQKVLFSDYNGVTKYNDYYIVKKDKYGIVDKNDDIIFEFEFDYTQICDKYLIVIKNNKLGIIQDNKLLVNYEINVSDNKINAYMFNNNIHINLYTPSEITYIVSDNKIKKVIYGILNTISISDYEINNEFNNINKNYTYLTSRKNDNISITIYDKNYDIYYENSVKTRIDYTKYNIQPTLIKYYSKNNYKLTLEGFNINTGEEIDKEYYYFDVDKKSALSELRALHEYLDNGYRFTINDKYELKIYNKDKLISTHNNIKYYIGGYFFGDTNGIIYKLEFKKESN